MTDAIKVALIAAGTSIVSAVVGAWTTFQQTAKRIRFRDRRRAQRARLHGERRKELE